ncbi:MAG: tyrosine-type recombinase/integrase [Pseudomonadota bacterium]
MRKYNNENEIIKKKYLVDMDEGDGFSKKTIEGAENAINRFLDYTNNECFKNTNSSKIKEFKNGLLVTKNKNGGKLSLSTIEHTLKPLQRFFKWLKKEDGYKKKLKLLDLRFLNLNREDRQKAHPRKKIKEYYSIEQVGLALNFNPKNIVEMRDRAIVAILACTAMRHESLITAKIKHVNLVQEALIQDPSTMSTKNSTLINTKMIPINDYIPQIVINWAKYLKEDLYFGDEDPLFPKEQLQHNEHNQFVGGVAISKEHIANHNSIPKIIKRVFARVGLEYRNPHSFRDMLTAHILANYGTQEAVALSMNFGHKNLATLINNYYNPTPEQQFDILSRIGKTKKKESDISNEQIIEYLKTQMEKK